MAPLTATAMPRWLVSTAFSSSKPASVATMSGSISPLTRMFASAAVCVIHFSLFCSGRKRAKPLDAERADRRIDDVIECEARDCVGGDRRQQNAVAMVSGGIDEPVDGPGTEDRCVVAAPGPRPAPHLIDGRVLDRGHPPPGCFQQAQHAARRERGVIAFFLNRGAY